jgi:hypothetical protein
MAISSNKRKKMEKLIYDFFDAFDKSGTNTKKYKDLFSPMSDAQFDNYFKALCQEFPVASTGVTINIIYEIVYMIGKLYRKYEPAYEFSIIFDEHLSDESLYNLLTLTLVFFRFNRNYFYNKILMDKVNNIMNYFSKLILLYLVFCIIFESVVYLIFYFGIILQVKKKDKLFNNFFESFKFD